MASQLRVALAQLNFLVGDIEGNRALVVDTVQRARADHHANVVVFPELTLTGYPPEDLLLRPSLEKRISRAMQGLCQQLDPDVYVVIGYPRRIDGQLYNMAGVIQGGQLRGEYAKQCLPNYQVFDEKRYFEAGNAPCVVDIDGHRVALTICEDIWHAHPVAQAREAGATLMLNLNASPFHIRKTDHRRELLGQRANDGGFPIVYTNLVGGQDELVFDGGSLVINANGELVLAAPEFQQGLYLVDFDGQRCQAVSRSEKPLSLEASVYQALVLGVRDYVNKNGFKGVVLGLSGGVDSALTLAVAVDALGADRVEAVMMPFRYTSQMSLEDAEEEARTLGVRYSVHSIEPMFESFMQTLAPAFEGMPRDTTEENLQARCRGVLLMALSNKKGYLVLTTGNKSEMAVGYSTLYGDMAGGFDVLKDVPKTLVFALCRYRNSLSPTIPERVITRPPSAELAPDQKDEDSLPPYEVLDRILELYVEQDFSAHDLIAEGFDEAVVARVIRLVDLNEYKRRQAPVGVRITQRGFGRDRRYPITSGWKAGE
ncbi:NAD+ synthase [Motiliproteus sediminis]|uniref:NAD+ synthase n=1 Tax=Motiliproteus sediminis TaxID=1468178 RepID=UPI001AEFB129|nr:NAD+ synthase [Motiliproteus sediminis]